MMAARRIVFAVAICGFTSCGPAWRPCFSDCRSPLPPRYRADPNTAPRVVDLMPTEPWRNIGITVRRGERLLITARGEVTWERHFHPAGPDGENGRPGWRVGRGGLVGKVGEDGKPFDIGARIDLFPDMHARPPHHPYPPPPLQMSRAGTLYLGFKGFSAGANAGAFHVTIQPAIPIGKP